ncbi:flavin reductase family protein [Mycobacterium branderi]|uniref:Flavin reductase n=1 Tax=Mycobacterium branderi TaxID=43348 RepID=A0A7I7WCM7_9MYCO|nr:flavin reductase family protein [Mycobacterium branderi]MCV7236339.1 flavin reductase family protein [Mycobacterium branderi]ORA35503.1 flavin reductase [Mycobacterium branderi]BBZ15224.1 oxidoreductase [Mycobacterium branderi]
MTASTAQTIDVDPVPTDPSKLRNAYGCFPSGVTAVCALVDGKPVGIAASSFTPVSVSPPLVSVCVQNTSTTWPRLRGRLRLGLSVLAEDQDLQCRALAMKNGDRFADIDWAPTSQGAVLVHGAAAWLDCSVHAEVPAGDHVIVLLEIHGVRCDPEAAPLVFHASQFRRLAAA